MFPVASVTANVDHVPVIDAGGMDAPTEGFDPLRIGHGHAQPHRNIAGDVIAAHAHRIGIDHVLFHKDRNRGRAAAHIDTGSAQLLLVFDQRRIARGIGRGGNPGKFQIAALNTAHQVLHRAGVHRQHMHIHRQRLTQLAAWIRKPRTIIKGKVHRLRMQHLAARTVFRHLTGGKHLGNLGFRDLLTVQLQPGIQPI